MAILFHGTRGEATVRRIFREGLRPPSPNGADASHDWAKHLTGVGRGELVFLSTSPVAGKGGDPVAFARGWPRPHLREGRGEPGFIVVADLPDDAGDIVRAVVPNDELDHYIEAHCMREHLRRGADFLTVMGQVEALAARRLPFTSSALEREIDVRVRVEGSEVVAQGELTADRWLRFVDEYVHLVEVRGPALDSGSAFEAERQKLLRRHRIRLPADIEEDSTSRRCGHCVGGIVFCSVGLRGRDDLRLGFHPATPVGRALAAPSGLADLLRIARVHAEPHPRGALAAWLRGRNNWAWRDYYRAFPVDEARLPPVWRPSYGRGRTARGFLRPDHQVIAERIGPEHILGAIAVTDGQRLLPRFGRGRGARGPLPSQLWRLAHALRTAAGGGIV